MLIDEYIANSRALIASPDRSWAGPDDISRARHLTAEKHTLDVLGRCQPFVLSPLTISTAADLARYQAKRLADGAQYLHLPAYETWLDLTAERPCGSAGGRTGILVIGNRDTKDILKGEMLITTYLQDGWAQLAGRFDLTQSLLWQSAGDANQEVAYRRHGGDPALLISTVWAAIALINTPRLTVLTGVDIGKLNKRRAERMHPPILEYKLVTIQIDRGEVGPNIARDNDGGRALHHVRAFLRFKRGRVELVRPHMRGNPRFGVIKHRYIALRAEDEAGPWRGGPPPPPRIIKEFDD